MTNVAAENLQGAPGRVLELDGLSVWLTSGKREKQILYDVSLSIGAGEIAGMVGESGSGKSMTALSVLGLIPASANPRLAGSVTLAGEELTGLPWRSIHALRGKRMAYIPQEPQSALNPTVSIGRQLTRVIRHHQGIGKRSAWRQAAQMLADVGIDQPERVLATHAHTLSGGMRQRVLIAMAFSCRPELILADEPTTALDVTVQAQVLGLLEEQARKSGASVLLISHDLGVVKQLCASIYVIYAGAVCESGPARAVLDAPAHPYTRALIDSLPSRHAPRSRIPVDSPGTDTAPETEGGCRYAGRCPQASQRCATAPARQPISGSSDQGQQVACWHPLNGGERA